MKAFDFLLNKREEKELREFIDEEKYLNIVLNINSEDFNFAPPSKKLINKMGSEKKRISKKSRKHLKVTKRN